MLNPIAGEAMTRQLEEQIAGLQQELAQAHTQIHRSEDRLRGTVQSLTELEDSVRSAFGSAGDSDLTATRWDSAAASSTALSSAATSTAAAAAAGVTMPVRPLRQGVAQQRRRQGRDAGLSSTLAIPEQLKDYWFPVEFGASLGEGKMVPFELFGQVRPPAPLRHEMPVVQCLHERTWPGQCSMASLPTCQRTCRMRPAATCSVCSSSCCGGGGDSSKLRQQPAPLTRCHRCAEMVFLFFSVLADVGALPG